MGREMGGEDLKTQVTAVLDGIRPHLQADGGDTGPPAVERMADRC